MSRTALRGPAHQLEVCMHIIISNNNNYCTRPRYGTERGILPLGNSFLLCTIFITPRVLNFNAFHYNMYSSGLKITVYTKVYRIQFKRNIKRGIKKRNIAGAVLRFS